MADSPSKPRWGGAPSVKCTKCEKTVYPAEKISMQSKIFHIECLRCVECNKKLTGSNWGAFIPPNDDAYCAVHLKNLVRTQGSGVSTSSLQWTADKEKTSNPLASKFGGGAVDPCQGCGKKCYIAEKCVMEGQTWHADCLRCTVCSKKLSGNNWGGFVVEAVEDGEEGETKSKPHCKPCHTKLVRAAGSSVGLSGPTSTWKKTGSSGSSGSSRFGGGGTPCIKCGKQAYLAEKVVMEGKVFHVDCLRCSQCNKKLSGNNWGGFVPPDDDAYCKPCHTKMVRAAGSSVALSGSTSTWKKTGGSGSSGGSRFGGGGTPCIKCGKQAYLAEKVVMEGKIFHVDCLRCTECNKKLSGNNWGGFVTDDDAYCKPCHSKLVRAAGSSVGISGSTGQWTPKEEGEKKSNPLAGRFGGGATEPCVGCGKKVYIAEKCSLEGQVWHENCLRCTDCNKKVSGANYGGFVPGGEANTPHCKPCYTKLVMAAGNSTAISGSNVRNSTEKKTSSTPSKFAGRFGGGSQEKCKGCGKSVYQAEKVMMEGKVWHGNCLRCSECNKLVTGANYGGFIPPNDDLMCKIHYDQLLAKLGSSVSISGSTAGNSQWEVKNEG